MSITEQIIHNLEALPEDMQQEVLDFLSFLRLRRRRGKTRPRSSEVFKKYRESSLASQARKTPQRLFLQKTLATGSSG
jgi:hypothetical protein